MQLGFRRPREFRLGPWIQVPRPSRQSLGDRNSALSAPGVPEGISKILNARDHARDRTRDPDPGPRRCYKQVHQTQRFWRSFENLVDPDFGPIFGSRKP